MIKRIINDDFLKNNIIFFIGSMAVAVLNYLYHPILGRMMSVEDFGEVQSLISLFMQLSIFTGIFNVITVNVVANYEDEKERNRIISSLRRIAFCIAGVLFFMVVACSALLRDFFQFSSVYPFVILAFLLIAGVSFTFRKAFLQGISDFRAVSWAGIISAAGRLGFAAILVYFGWRSFGAISALLIAQGLALAYVYFKTKKTFNLSIFSKPRRKVPLVGGIKPPTAIKYHTSDFVRSFSLRGKDGIGAVIKTEYRYAILIFLATSAITFLYTADVLMVKHWFAPEEAGLYSGIATIARIIFFATGSVSGVLLAAIKIKNAPEVNKKILKKGLILILLIAGAGLLIFSVFPELIINILIGSRYTVLAPLLPALSLLLALVSLINLLFFYFLALRRSIIFSASLAGPLVIILLSLFRHESLEQIIHNFLIGSAVVLAALFYGIFKRRDAPRRVSTQ